LNGHLVASSVATTKTLARPTHLKLDNTSYSNLQDYSTLTAPQQRLDNLLEQSNAPPPPERGSSFAVMSQAFRSPVATTPSAQNRSDLSQTNNNTITPKKVSFQETTSEIMGSNSTPVEKVMEDPNVSCIVHCTHIDEHFFLRFYRFTAVHKRSGIYVSLSEES
jgi:hypothetical protein